MGAGVEAWTLTVARGAQPTVAPSFCERGDCIGGVFTLAGRVWSG